MATAASIKAAPAAAPMTKEEKKVIFASSLGTVFEWYDFYLYGSLAVFIGKQFFAALDPTAQFIASLLAFADPTHITFGSDWPYAPKERSAHFAQLLDQFPLTNEQRAAIHHDNARGLFARWNQPA